MIINLIILIVYGALGGLLLLLPTITDTGAFTTAIITVSGYISAIYNIIPLITGTLLIILSFDIAFEVGYMLYKVIYWVIRRFPTQS
jgi:hypothetical protein